MVKERCDCDKLYEEVEAFLNRTDVKPMWVSRTAESNASVKQPAEGRIATLAAVNAAMEYHHACALSKRVVIENLWITDGELAVD